MLEVLLPTGIIALAAFAYVARRPLERTLFPARQTGRVLLIALRDAARATSDWLGTRGNVFWAVTLTVIGLGIYLPYLSVYPLWDPWEPHYTQVAWEMQERGTWLRPWYRGLDNWWSKPILLLWMLRASLGLLWDPMQDFAANELAARLPFALAAVAGGLLQFDWVRRLWGRATGVLAAIIVMTAPQYLLIGRQVMIDVTFVVTNAAALGYLAVGLFTRRPEPRPGAWGWWRRNYPFALFWGLQAISVLAKGFVPPVLAVLALAAYWAATFRWRDYADLTAGRHWPTYLLQRGLLAAAVAGVVALALFGMRYVVGFAPDERRLYAALLLGAAGVTIALAVFHDLPPCRHALNLLKRIRASWGLPLFFAISAPWFIYMSFAHGWPFWNEFIFYHHLGRAAGTIDKPNNTFDYFVLQIGVALFPWSAFLAGAIWQLAARANLWRSIAGRRNAYLLFTIALTYLFFNMSLTKFAHYIFPVVPFLATAIAATLVWLGRVTPEPIPFDEEGPPLGAPVPPDVGDETPKSGTPGSKGELVAFAALALVGFGILAHDLAIDFRLFLRTFIYYYNRETPNDYNPSVTLQWLFAPAGITIGTLLLSRAVSRLQMAALSGAAIALSCYLAWVTLPAMKDTFSYEPIYHAYSRLAKAGEDVGQYNDWQQPERSVIFLFKNQAIHLRNNQQARAFLQRPGRKFIIVEANRLPALRRVARDVEKTLYVVFDGHPYVRLVSDVPEAADERRATGHVLTELPADAQRNGADFGPIELAGWSVEPPEVAPGGTANVTFYYRCKELMDRDWQIFVHGDGPRGGSHRLHRDHFPVDGLYPTTEWQVGEIIKDTFTLEVPGDYPYEQIVLWNGWYIGTTRLELKNAVSNDGDNRVRGPTIRVKRSD
jgi:4-amino-4-deoxy-L-arabinose transferase-like glycosyltransferase